MTHISALVTDICRCESQSLQTSILQASPAGDELGQQCVRAEPASTTSTSSSFLLHCCWHWRLVWVVVTLCNWGFLFNICQTILTKIWWWKHLWDQCWWYCWRCSQRVLQRVSHSWWWFWWNGSMMVGPAAPVSSWPYLVTLSNINLFSYWIIDFQSWRSSDVLVLKRNHFNKKIFLLKQTIE